MWSAEDDCACCFAPPGGVRAGAVTEDRPHDRDAVHHPGARHAHPVRRLRADRRRPAPAPEEASQDLFEAVRTRDAKRLDALLPTAENLTALGLPAAEATAIRERASKAAAKLTEAAEQLKLTPEAKWIHLETAPPHTTP